MITQIELCFAHHLKVKGSATLRFRPGINVLIGPNGSGKSTVLRALHACSECRTTKTGNPEIFYFNSETMNPHAPKGPAGDVRGMVLRTRGIFSSHGEIMRSALFSMPIQQGGVLLVDEPEAGQDLAGVERIRKGFDEICASGGQVIAASHHPLLMREAHLIELVPDYAETVRSSLCQSICGNPAPRQNPPREGPGDKES